MTTKAKRLTSRVLWARKKGISPNASISERRGGVVLTVHRGISPLDESVFIHRASMRGTAKALYRVLDGKEPS